VSIGADTIIRPFSYVGRDSAIGPDCTIGPFVTIPRQSIVPEGTTVAAQISTETSVLDQFKGTR
jgi:UDP-3-O-[3-hydroxymyristoyl] glucosamine N-acyltransferase